MKNKISRKAIIINPVKIGKNVIIGPYSIIGPNVTLGDNIQIDSHVTIKGETIIGCKNRFFKFSCIGEEAQHLNNIYNSRSKLIIGDNNTFREYTTIHKGTTRNNSCTIIGNNNYFMIGVHIAHDCLIGNNIIFANKASIAGHVTIDDYANISGFVGIHQHVYIGTHSMIAGGSIVYKDVLPFVVVAGYPAKTKKLNIIGLRRRNFKNSTIEEIKKIYKIIFKSTSTIEKIILDLEILAIKDLEKKVIINFLKFSKRGIIR
ncbi:MAG TPA: acyl-ACP--UDP-N-acetylglucosamine O-acyltransferase [Candidatus Azoamicus sp. OHIO1]